MPPYTAQQFADAFHAVSPGVQVDPHGGWPGYVSINGPANATGEPQQCWVKVELTNATVAFAAPIAAGMGAHQRPQLPINVHPLGYSAGPNFGRFDHAVSADEVVERFPVSAEDFVRAIIGTFALTGTPW